MDTSLVSISDVSDSNVSAVRHDSSGQLPSLIHSTQSHGNDDIYTEDSRTSSNQPPGDVDVSCSDSDGEPKPKYGKKTRGRVKIKMQFISNKLRRYTTFSKRKTGIMKKAYELSTLTGTQVMLLVASETGHVYTFATKKLQPMITSESGKALIQTCLNSPDTGPITARDIENDRRMNPNGFEETELSYVVAEDDDEPNAELHQTSVVGSTNHQEKTNQLLLSQNPNISSSVASTFNFNTIIPPTSNSDGTMNKTTNVTMHIPQNIPTSSIGGVELISSSAASDRRSLHNQPESVEMQIQRQREEIRRLERQQQEQQRQQQQRQQQENTQAQIIQQLTTPTSALQTSQIVIPRGAVSTPPTVLGGGNTDNSQVVYQPSSGQTVLYTPTAISTLDLQPLVNLVNAQGLQTFNTSSNTPGTGSNTPAQQYITIPVSLATNQVFQQMVPNTIEVGKKT